MSDELCRICGKSFHVKPSRIGKAFYCSRACFHKAPIWSKGLTLETDPRLERPSLKGRPVCLNLSPEKETERRKKISSTMKRVGGGYRPGSGRGKSGTYRGFKCDSSWELAWVVYNLNHKIPFERNKIVIPYVWKGKERKYYPDFQLSDGSFVEIKGFKSFQSETKRLAAEALGIRIHQVTKKEIQPYLNYVVSLYGKDFWVKLYE